MIASKYSPDPDAIPIEETIQRVAAVVSPITFFSVFMMVPAPRKLIPTTMDAAIRAESDSGKACKDKIFT